MENNMTVQESAEARGIKSFDVALPQPWVDAVRKIFGGTLPEPMRNVVWCYDAPFSLIGIPRAITEDGDVLLGALAGREGLR